MRNSGKRKKPKNNITKTNSTFVTKITTHENLAKILANRAGEDVYLFWNTGKTFTWSDLGQKPNEPLSHILFSKAFPSSHDVNVLTRSCDHLDVIIGFSTGDIIWFDPLCNKYYRLNKQAIIKDSAVTMIKWMPGSESQFMAAFHDGSILIMDKERDDNAFSVPASSNENVFQVTRPKGKHNPISHWQVSKKPITAFAFSPDLQHVAVVSMDGCLRIIDFRNERLLDTFSAYFGALNCVCWSPDGKYILTGGQDDLVTIWSFKDQRIVARCQGHQSYVTGVAFDPWRCDERNYRFGSVGEDAKLLLWDFSVSALHKPKAAIAHRRGSNATVLNMAGSGSAGYKPGHASKGSISSLRGSGGHSLFSGHHTSKPSTAQPLQTTPTPAPAAAISSSNHHHYHQHPPAIAEEPSPELVSSDTTTVASLSQHSGMSEPHPMASAGGGNSSSMFSIYSSTPASDIGRSRAFSASTAMTSSAAGIKTFSSSPSSSNNSDINNASSSNAVYKKSSHARTLPHLHLSKQQAHYPDNTYGGEHMNSQQQGQGYSSSSIFRSNSNVQSNGSVQLVRPPEPRSHVAMLQPLMVKSVHQEPLASITFREDAIMTSDRRGHIKVWKRPPVSPQHR
ncbi:WD40-repeat-containing domain protein [Lobosporangium transversale]|uniref:WD40-repeat-containing domain protein n=1 Tax=Lobosporangium transversale TaxID=64571 RepID=A0A1Y2GMD9_9FUNG|nr:WD40-repeat-containing domain protein [Lobosporangium transversale]ORZ14277.1 WD40-repeat-containing domain protein [Lobosporangium transversale]|eukprot:XP_021880755.1 WD40-repeat-containing domain protein [Lobosporangium transversale]